MIPERISATAGIPIDHQSAAAAPSEASTIAKPIRARARPRAVCPRIVSAPRPASMLNENTATRTKRPGPPARAIPGTQR